LKYNLRNHCFIFCSSFVLQQCSSESMHQLGRRSTVIILALVLSCRRPEYYLCLSWVYPRLSNSIIGPITLEIQRVYLFLCISSGP
jgi:hypothetical protein